jgi:hypothetical protein
VSRQVRDAVAKAADGRPTLQVWLDRVSAVSPECATAVEGIWCGRDGRSVLEFNAWHNLVVGWYAGRVEYSYVS